MRKKLNAPSSLGATVTREIRAATEEAVARARLAGVEPTGAAKSSMSALSELSAKTREALEEASKAQAKLAEALRGADISERAGTIVLKSAGRKARRSAREYSTSNKN